VLHVHNKTEKKTNNITTPNIPTYVKL